MSRIQLLVGFVALLLSVAGAAAHAPATRQQPSAGGAAAGPALLVPANGGCFVAALSGKSEVPPNYNTAAVGFGVFVLSPDQARLTFHIQYANLSGAETAARVHSGAVDSNGESAFELPAGNPKDGTVAFDITAVVADLLAEQLYVNISSTSAPEGEIRGQILPGGGCFAAALSGGQATPSNDSGATGRAIFALSPDQARLTYHVEYSGLTGSETGAHIRKGAAASLGEVVFDFASQSLASSPKTGTLTFSSTLTHGDLLAGRLYIDITTSNYPGGEIRAQILPISNCFAVQLAGANATPPNGSTGGGGATFVLSSDQTKVFYHLTYHSLGSPATRAHIHKGAIGSAGAEVFNLFSISDAGSPKNGAIIFGGPLSLTDLLAGQLYVDIHTSNYPGGEIRGQMAAGMCKTFLPAIVLPASF
jgi:CHRD domain-containing protein